MTFLSCFQIERCDVIDDLDGILIKLCSDSNEKKEHFFYYFYKKLFLNNNMYAYNDKHIPEFTRHDFSHIHGVLRNIYEIIKDRLLFKVEENGDIINNEDYNIQTSNSSYGFSFWELYYLVMAAIYHDAGIMFGRDDHGKNLRKIFEIEKSIKLKGYFMQDICNIATAHTGDNAIDDLKPERIFPPDNTILINSKFLAALLRIADEFHEGPERTNRIQMRRFMNDTNKLYHFFSWMVNDISFNSIDKEIMVYLNLRFEDDDSIEFKKLMCDFIIKRFEKYLKELKYCNKFDLKNMLFNKLSLEIIYYTKDDEDREYKIILEDDKDIIKLEEELKSIFKDEIL